MPNRLDRAYAAYRVESLEGAKVSDATVTELLEALKQVAKPIAFRRGIFDPEVPYDASVNTFMKLSQFKGEASFSTWATRGLANALIDEVRVDSIEFVPLDLADGPVEGRSELKLLTTQFLATLDADELKAAKLLMHGAWAADITREMGLHPEQTSRLLKRLFDKGKEFYK